MVILGVNFAPYLQLQASDILRLAATPVCECCQPSIEISQFSFVSARALLAWLCQERYRAVAHAARGAQCRDDGSDDAADDLEDQLPGFLVVFHGVRWFLRVI